MKFNFTVTEVLPKKDYLFIRKIPADYQGFSSPAKLAMTIRYGGTYTEKEWLTLPTNEDEDKCLSYLRGGIPITTFERWVGKYIKKHQEMKIVFGSVEPMLEGFIPKEPYKVSDDEIKEMAAKKGLSVFYTMSFYELYKEFDCRVFKDRSRNNLIKFLGEK